MVTETELATEETLTQKPGDPDTWVRDIMLPHFHLVGEKSVARTPTPRNSFSERKSYEPSAVDATEKARRARRHALILPREHGAWGLLLVPMVTGAGVAFRQSPHIVPFLLLLTAALALFWLRTPAESLLGTSAMRAQSKDERRYVVVMMAVLGTIAIAVLAALLWAGRNPYLWLIGVVAVVAFAAQAFLKNPQLAWRRAPRPSREAAGQRPGSKNPAHNHRMLAEVIGTIGLTASAPAAYYVITGKLGPTAVILWVANLIFAGDQIHYVQLRLHTAKIDGFRARLARGWAFALGQALMTVALTIAGVGGLIPTFASLAFAPLLFRGWYYFIQQPTPLQVRRLGWSELAHSVAFCVLLIAMI